MNNDIISRSALKEEIRQEVIENRVGVFVAKRILKLIDNAPTVELDESVIQEVLNKRCMTAVANEYLIALHGKRPQGEWIRYRDNPHQPEHIKCSNCGQYWSIADHDKTFDFCFNCGAKMKGGAE